MKGIKSSRLCCVCYRLPHRQINEFAKEFKCKWVQVGGSQDGGDYVLITTSRKRAMGVGMCLGVGRFVRKMQSRVDSDSVKMTGHKLRDQGLKIADTNDVLLLLATP